MRTTRRLTTMVLCALAATVAGTGTAAAGAAGSDAEAARTWYPHTESYASEDDNGGRDVFASLNTGTGLFYEVGFWAYGEGFYARENSTDGHGLKAYISVEGFGTATYTIDTAADDWNLSFPEGRAVSVQVCIDGTSTCSGWAHGGRT